MKEIELKAHITSHQQMLTKLQASYKFIDHIINEDKYFKSDSSITEQARLRTRKDSKGSYFVATSKIKTINNGIEVNEEVEFEVSDGANFIKMMEMLDLKFSYSKRKEVYLFKDDIFSYELVSIEGLGDFIEIETLTEDESKIESLRGLLLKALLALGVDESAIESKSYKELLLGKGH